MKSVNKGWWKSPAHSFFLLYIYGYNYFPGDQDSEGMQGSSFFFYQGRPQENEMREWPYL